MWGVAECSIAAEPPACTIVRMESTSGAAPYRRLDDLETLRLLAQNLGEGLYIADASGRVLDANPAFLEMLGANAVDALGAWHAPEQYADPSRLETWNALLARDGKVRNFEWELIRPDEERRTVLDTAYLVVDPGTGERFLHGFLVDTSAHTALERQLRDQLTRDALTGCYNRRFLLDLGAQLQLDQGATWGCLFLDIDHFKRYNDEHGHAEGDRVLARMARFLMRQVRADERVVRVGGDEFVIVLQDTTAERTEHVATRLQQAAARSAPVRFSLGWAVREGGEDLEATIARADHAMIDVRVLTRGGATPRLPEEMERRELR